MVCGVFGLGYVIISKLGVCQVRDEKYLSLRRQHNPGEVIISEMWTEKKLRINVGGSISLTSVSHGETEDLIELPMEKDIDGQSIKERNGSMLKFPISDIDGEVSTQTIFFYPNGKRTKVIYPNQYNSFDYPAPYIAEISDKPFIVIPTSVYEIKNDTNRSIAYAINAANFYDDDEVYVEDTDEQAVNPTDFFTDNQSNLHILSVDDNTQIKRNQQNMQG